MSKDKEMELSALKNKKGKEEEDETDTEKMEGADLLKLTGYTQQLKETFDYEVNSIKMEETEEMNCKMYYYDPKRKQNRIINYDSFKDRQIPLPVLDNDKLASSRTQKEAEEIALIDKGFTVVQPKPDKDEKGNPIPKEKVATANCMKRLVSKQKRRLQTKDFDLDMSYVTRNVIAMGFPSTGCETVYRNSAADLREFFRIYHNNNVKIYNLCIEKERIYSKSLFEKCQVGLFPATDHNPCPIMLILEFCVDICLYLIKNPDGLAAIHCKAGKGRTGVMICSYLIFSQICKTSDIAFRYYGRVRTKDCTGVTIPSQKRYIRYFETFLQANFCPPYIYLIPKIIKTHLNFMYEKKARRYHVESVLKSFCKFTHYFTSSNKFCLKNITIGPLPKGLSISMKISTFVNSNLNEDNQHFEEITKTDKNGNVNYIIQLDGLSSIRSDIKIALSGGINFYVWINLWYSTWELIKKNYDTNYNTRGLNQSVVENPKSNEETAILNQNDISSLDRSKAELVKNTPFIEDDKSFNSELQSKMMNAKNRGGENKEEVKRKPKMSLYEVIFKLKHNNDLNELLEKIDELSEGKGIQLDKDNLYIELGNTAFDKFEEAKKYQNQELKFGINYYLMETDK
ncbi:MAG: hypothetical protein MJ252_26900 [archaeon]|nr:hypothetical protein [archaeon]